MSGRGKWRTLLKDVMWSWVKETPIRTAITLISAAILGSGITVFSAERILLKSRINFGIFISKDEKFEENFLETLSSRMLKNVISPQVIVKRYYMVTGEHGTGKSTASRHNAHLLGHKGIVYVNVPDSGDPHDFEDSLAERLHLYHLIYDKLITFASLYTAAILLDFPAYDGDKKASYLRIILKKLVVLSRQYKRWHGGKGVVLVIDQVNNFLKNEKGMRYLEILQDSAKYMAVSNIFSTPLI